MFIIILDLTEWRVLFPSWVHTKQSDNKDYEGKRKNSVVKEDFLKEPQRKCLIRRSAVPETTE